MEEPFGTMCYWHNRDVVPALLPSSTTPTPLSFRTTFGNKDARGSRPSPHGPHGARTADVCFVADAFRRGS